MKYETASRARDRGRGRSKACFRAEREITRRNQKKIFSFFFSKKKNIWKRRPSELEKKKIKNKTWSFDEAAELPMGCVAGGGGGGGGGGSGCSMLPVGCTRGRCIAEGGHLRESVTESSVQYNRRVSCVDELDALQPRESAARARERERTLTRGLNEHSERCEREQLGKQSFGLDRRQKNSNRVR